MNPVSVRSIGAFINIFNAAGQVLCVHRAYGDCTWSTPGGKVEDGEDPLQAVIRETQEEVGIDVSDVTFSGLYWKSYANDLVVSFVAHYNPDNFSFSSNVEISAAGFFDADHLPSPMATNTVVRIRDAVTRSAHRLTIFKAPDQYFLL